MRVVQNTEVLGRQTVDLFYPGARSCNRRQANNQALPEYLSVGANYRLIVYKRIKHIFTVCSHCFRAAASLR